MRTKVTKEVQVGIFPVTPLICDSCWCPMFIVTEDLFLRKELEGTIKTTTAWIIRTMWETRKGIRGGGGTEIVEVASTI